MATTQGKGALLAAEISKAGAPKAKGLAPHSNVFIGNLDASVTEDDVRAAFAPFGAIESCLLTSKAGRPCAFVKMAEEDAAMQAIAGLNGNAGWMVKFANYDVGQAPKWSSKGSFGAKGGWKGFDPFALMFKGGYGYGGFPFGGKDFFKGAKGFGKGFEFGKGFDKGFGKGFGKASTLELREDGSDEKPEPPPSDNLYIKHLPLGVTEDNLRETFEKSGAIEQLRILRPDYALECAALIRYSSPEEATAARTTLDGTVVSGSTPPLFAKSQTKQGASKEDHVYVKNVPTNTPDEKIVELFSKYGEVKWSKVMRTTSGQSRIGSTCAALVEMSTTDEVLAAVAALNGSVLNFSELIRPMRVRYAENKTPPKEVVAPPAPALEEPQVPGTRLAEGFAPPA